MTMRLTLLSATLLALPPLAVAQEAARDSLGFVCEAAGYDVILLNGGDDPLPAQTRVAWSVPFTRSRGEYLLEEEMPAGSRIFVAAALGSTYVTGSRECIIGEVLVPAQDG